MAHQPEAKARIKINHLLEKAGWRFFADENGPATILPEAHTAWTRETLNALGDNFEGVKHGFMDYLLVNEQQVPMLVVEAKSENKNPMDGKEQARRYARANHVRFVILSNGNLHYFWDLESGNPRVITEYPTLQSLQAKGKHLPRPELLSREKVESDYIALSQDPAYRRSPDWINEETRPQFLAATGLRFLREYQLRAIHALQHAAEKGSDRFLFEMATGTGKTLTAAAVIKLFLRTRNATRVLFLVDRIELENQAMKSFRQYLQNDYETVIYKQKRDDWRRAQIVVTTVQSLMFNNKYMDLFSPTDFDLVISDEAHRSINGNARAVFEYFVGYKLGLTATPKDYLKHINPEKLSQDDPRAWERRQLLDTYKTFGCADGEPTFRYSLLDGVREGFLINPVVVDARTEITTQLLSDQGYAVLVQNAEGEEGELTYGYRDFEKTFFSEFTNWTFCQAFLEHALHDPVNGEIGKSICFCVSQDHAEKITAILNELAEQMWPGRYHSDFAVQVTSRIPDAQQFTLNFANNNLNGHSRVVPGYRTSKTRVCVTVGMMTTGYDCQDLLNLCLMRPVFSPTDFIQIKGRGTRRFNFKFEGKLHGQRQTLEQHKAHFKLFDFFANCEYFEEQFDYDEKLQLPAQPAPGKNGVSEPRIGKDGADQPALPAQTTINDRDRITSLVEQVIGAEGMKIDRELFQRWARPILADADISTAVDLEQWDKATAILRDRYVDKPQDFVTLEKLIHSEGLDRRLTWREVLERIFGIIPGFKSRSELLEEEVQKFIATYQPESAQVPLIRNFLITYITDPTVRDIIDQRQFAKLNTNARLPMAEFMALEQQWRRQVPEYVKDYVRLNTFI
ncbi:MAG: DEAD/DEAH box helicase family protein [Anaerolineae bacterium]|nr:DEAD/DEAH box helicase family protein [Anaerolineae bacterium]